MAAGHLLARARKDRARLDVYAVSAFAGWTPETTIEEIVASGNIPHEMIQTSRAQRIRDAGFTIGWSFGRPHCTIDLGEDPTEETAARLVEAFDPPVPNPGLRGRR